MVKDASHLFSSLVIMNTGVPTGFDFTDRKELLKVIASHITNSCLEGAQLISFKKFAFYKFYLNLINLTPLYISSIWFNWFDWKLKLKIKSTPASPIHCVENQRPPFRHIPPCPPSFLKIPQKQVCWGSSYMRMASSFIIHPWYIQYVSNICQPSFLMIPQKQVRKSSKKIYIL